MRLTDLLKHTRVDEAPLGDYQTIGDWGEKEKARSFAQATDRSMIQHPAAIKRAHKMFGRTEHVLNFYFVNMPGLRKYSESGVMSPEDIAQAMPKAWPEIEARGRDGVDHKNGINFIFVSNTGFQRMPMTPWIMAHRIGHALSASERGYSKNSGSWKDYEDDAAMFFADLLQGVYDWNIPARDIFMGGGPSMVKFLEAIGGMRSARKGKLGGRAYEFLYEMFAQYITQGALKFRPCPQSFGARDSQWYRIQDQDVADMWNRSLNDEVGDHLGTRIDNCLYSMEGKFLVM